MALAGIGCSGQSWTTSRSGNISSRMREDGRRGADEGCLCVVRSAIVQYWVGLVGVDRFGSVLFCWGHLFVFHCMWF